MAGKHRAPDGENLAGQISDRLRKALPKGDKSWTPERASYPEKPKPADVEGHKFTGRGGK